MELSPKEQLEALYRFFERGVQGDLSPMEVIQVCTRGQLLVVQYAAEHDVTLEVEGDRTSN